MSETPKLAETKKAPEATNTKKELPHVQELKKLDTTSKQLDSIRQKQGVSRGKKLQKSQEEDADKALLDGLGSEPGTLVKAEEKTSKTLMEEMEGEDQKLERELRDTKSMYQTQLKKTYETHIADLKDKPEEQKKTGQEYLGRCIKDLKINSGAPGENDVKLIVISLPDVWKQTLLDPKSAENNPEIKKMRDVILDRVSDGAASIDRGDFSDDKSYQKALLEDIQSITGVAITVDEIQTLLRQNALPSNLQKAFAPLAATGGNPEQQKIWKEKIDSDGFYAPPSSQDLMQNSGEVIGDNPDFSEIYTAYNGIKEPDARINEFHRAAGLNAGPKTPWCMSFVQYVLRKHYGYQGPQTASARDGLRIGTPHSSYKDAQPGDLVLMPRNGGSGYHIAFVQKIEGNTLSYLGGNQSNSVCTKKCDVDKAGLQFRNITSSSTSLAGGH